MRVAPMLAKPAKDEVAILTDRKFIAERKYDGYRAMVDLRPGKMHCWSRIGNDNLTDVPWLKQLGHVAREMLLDGELVVPGGTSSDVALLDNRDRLVYVVFDLLSWNDETVLEMPFASRRQLLETFVDLAQEFLGERLQLSVLSTDAEGLLGLVKAERGEGIMMKDLAAPYSPGKRSWTWQKVKVYQSYDVVVTSCEAKPTEWRVRPGQKGTDGQVYPDGLHTDPWLAGHVGLTYGWYREGQLVTVGSLGYTGMQKDLEQYVGQVAEVKAYGLYKTGALRHPGVLRFRDDKRPEECIFEDETVSL